MTRLRRYLAVLWIALRGEPGYSIVRDSEIDDMRERIARYDRRAAASKKSRANRAQPKEATA